MRTDRPRGAPILLLLAILAPAACGGSGSLETRTFDLRHLRPAVALEIVEPYVFTDRSDAPGQVSISEESRTLTVREVPDNLARIERLLAERDRPAPGVSLHFQVIEAGPVPTAPDPAIAEIEDALREVFRFERYRLAGEAVVRTADGSDFAQRMYGNFVGSISGELSAVRPAEGGPAAGRLRVWLWPDEQLPILNTTVNLQDGRTIIVGTAGTGTASDAIILVVRPTFEP